VAERQADPLMLVVSLLRLASPSRRVVTLMPADGVTGLPFVLVRLITSPASVDSRFRWGTAVIQVDVYAASLSAATTVAEDVRVDLVEAWEAQTVISDVGFIATQPETSAAVLSTGSDGPDGRAHVVSTHRFDTGL
jgi:hypothetical protein